MKEILKTHISNEFLYELPEKWIKKIEKSIDDFFLNQPERSKREDFCLTKLADQYLDKWEPLPTEFATGQEAYIRGVYDFSDWLKQKMRYSEQCSNALREVQ